MLLIAVPCTLVLFPIGGISVLEPNGLPGSMTAEERERSPAPVEQAFSLPVTHGIITFPDA